MPEGVTLEVTYDRSALIGRTLHTVAKNLLEGGTLVIAVLLIMLGSLRAGLITALAIPLSMLFATSLMQTFGVHGQFDEPWCDRLRPDCGFVRDHD
jgi:cobalt-zinc-cadmium resistance protein CzcA